MMMSSSASETDSRQQASPRLVLNDFLSPRSSISAPFKSRPFDCHKSTRTRPLPMRRKDVMMQDSLRSRFMDKAHKLDCGDADEIWTYHRCRDFEAKDPLERRLLEQGITPVYDPAHKEVPCYRPLVPDILDLRVFLNTPGPKAGGCFQCHIYRKHESNMLYSRYKLCLSERDRFLLSARKRKKSKTSNYVVSIDENDISNKTGNYFGKLRSNFMGSEFLIYDKGERPQLYVVYSSSSKKVRMELGGVMYCVKHAFGRGSQRMTAVIPALTELKPHVFQPLSKGSSTIVQKYKSGRDLDRMTVLHNKHNPELGHGRTSKRNFQLVAENSRDRIALQFLKVDKNIYTMDYQYPLSAFQAFAVCLSSL